MTPLEIATALAHALDSKKGEGIKVLEITDLTVLADYFVICAGSSSTQVRALADEAEYQLTQKGVKPLRVEGVDRSGWMLLDYGSVIVHVFDQPTRDFYSLERLWADAKPVAIELDQ